MLIIIFFIGKSKGQILSVGQEVLSPTKGNLVQNNLLYSATAEVNLGVCYKSTWNICRQREIEVWPTTLPELRCHLYKSNGIVLLFFAMFQVSLKGLFEVRYL